MSWSVLFDVASGILLVLGALLSLAGAIGLVRFPDTLARLHAATKPQTLGMILVLSGLALQLRSWAALTTLLVVVTTQFFTLPVTAHLVGRSAYRHGNVRKDLLVADDLSDTVERTGWDPMH